MGVGNTYTRSSCNGGYEQSVNAALMVYPLACFFIRWAGYQRSTATVVALGHKLATYLDKSPHFAPADAINLVHLV